MGPVAVEELAASDFYTAIAALPLLALGIVRPRWTRLVLGVGTATKDQDGRGLARHPAAPCEEIGHQRGLRDALVGLLAAAIQPVPAL